jgi:hypothetical protein
MAVQMIYWCTVIGSMLRGLFVHIVTEITFELCLQVVAISEAYKSNPSNWLLDTIGGNIVLAAICLAVFAGISTLGAFLYTKFVINPKSVYIILGKGLFY